MSDTANVAQRAYHQVFGRSPATAASRTQNTASTRGFSGEPTRHSLVDELGELHGRGMYVPFDEASAERETLERLLRLAALGKEDASLVMRTGRSGPHPAGWLRPVEGAFDAFEQGYLAGTGLSPSASMSRHAVQGCGAGTAELLPHDDRDLREALSDLDSLNEEAKADDLPEPDAEAVANARTLLPRLYAILPARYRVSPTERRGVAIDAPMKWGASVAVECAPDDTVYCFATIGGNSRRAKFYQMDGLPDVFIEKALRDLAAG